MTRTITDTADRLRDADQVLINGRWLLILGIAAASPPSRLTLTVCDPHGALSDLGDAHVMHVGAGETVTFRGDFFLADVTGRRPGGV